MIIDCENILKLSKFSIIGINALNENNIAEGSRFSSMKMNTNLRFNALLPIKRFKGLSEENIKWYIEIQTLINERIKNRESAIQ